MDHYSIGRISIPAVRGGNLQEHWSKPPKETRKTDTALNEKALKPEGLGHDPETVNSFSLFF